MAEEVRSQYDKMTRTPIEKLIIVLSIPTILSMMVTNIYNLVDTAFVSELGTSESGAVSVILGLMAILQAIGFLFGQGAGSILSRKLGEKDIKEASLVATTGVLGSFLSAFLVEVFGLVVIDKLVMWLGSTVTIAPHAKDYVFYILLSAPATAASFTLNNLLRYEGKAKLGMIGLMTGAILNIGGDYVLIKIFNLRVAGAGISTAIAQTISFLILLYMFIGGKTQCKITFKDYSFTFKRFMDIVLTGFPSMIRQALNSVTTILLNSVLRPYGDEALAAMGIVSKIIFFSFSVALGVGQGFQPVSAFNFGAKRYDRVRKAYWVTVLLSALTLLAFAGTTYAFAEPLIRQFREDALVVEIGTRALRLQCVAQIVMPICMTTEMLYQSTGKKLGASLLSASRGGFFFIPALLILPKFRGLSGIEEAQPVAFYLSFLPAVICLIIYLRQLKNKENELKESENN